MANQPQGTHERGPPRRRPSPPAPAHAESVARQGLGRARTQLGRIALYAAEAAASASSLARVWRRSGVAARRVIPHGRHTRARRRANKIVVRTDVGMSCEPSTAIGSDCTIGRPPRHARDGRLRARQKERRGIRRVAGRSFGLRTDVSVVPSAAPSATMRWCLTLRPSESGHPSRSVGRCWPA